MYVVAGASGNTGKVVAETLLAQEKGVRVIVRDAKKGEPWKAKGAEIAVAGLDDVDALRDAHRGDEGAYLLLPPQLRARRRPRGQREAHGRLRQGRRGERREARRVPVVDRGAARQGTGPITSVHDAEAVLRSIPVDVTVLRAAYFMENWGASLYALAKGELPTFLAATKRSRWSRPRHRTTLASALLEGGQAAHDVELSGPREYSPTDVAAALARITGKSVKSAEGPLEYMIPPSPARVSTPIGPGSTKR